MKASTFRLSRAAALFLEAYVPMLIFCMHKSGVGRARQAGICGLASIRYNWPIFWLCAGEQCGIEVWQEIFEFSEPKSNEFPQRRCSCCPKVLIPFLFSPIPPISYAPVCVGAHETGNESSGN